VVFLINTNVFADPFLKADCIENIDYYVISINEKQYTIQPNIDEFLLYNLKDLIDGQHQIEIICGHYKLNEGQAVSFFILKETKPQWIFYTIKKNFKQQDKDPFYNDRFSTPLRIKIPNR
jgi:hypothetical protein